MGGEGNGFIWKPSDMKKGAEAPLFFADVSRYPLTLRQG